MTHLQNILSDTSPFNISTPLSGIWYLSLSANNDKLYTTATATLTGGKYNSLPYWVFDTSPAGFQKAKQYYTATRQVSGYPQTVIPNNLSEALLKCVPASVGVPLTGATGRRQYDPFFRNVQENFAFFVVPASGSPDPYVFVNKNDFTNPNTPYFSYIPEKYDVELHISPDGVGTALRKNQYAIRYSGKTPNILARKGKPRAAVAAGSRKIRTRTKLDANWLTNANASLSGSKEVLQYIHTQCLRNSDYGRKGKGTFEVKIGSKFTSLLQGMRYYGKRFNSSVHFATANVRPELGDVARISYRTILRSSSAQVMIDPKPVYAQHARGNQNVDFEYSINFYSYNKCKRFFVQWYDESAQRWAQSYIDYSNAPNLAGTISTGLSGNYKETRWHKSDGRNFSVFGTYAALSAAASILSRNIDLTGPDVLARQYVTGTLPVSAFFVNPSYTFSANTPIGSLSAGIDPTVALVNANVNLFTSNTLNASGAAPSISLQKIAVGVTGQFDLRAVIAGAYPINNSNYFVNVNNGGWVAWPGGTSNTWTSRRSAGTYTVRVKDVANRGGDGSIAAAVSYPGADPVLPPPPALSASVQSVPLFVSNAISLYNANPAISLDALQQPSLRSLRISYTNIARDYGFDLTSRSSISLFLSSARIRINGTANLNGVVGPIPTPFTVIGAPIGGAPSPTGNANETLYTINVPFNRTGSVSVSGSAPLSNFRLWANNRPGIMNFSQIASLYSRRIDLPTQIYQARTMTVGLEFQAINPRPTISLGQFATGVANQFRLRVSINGPLTINNTNYFVRVNGGTWTGWPGNVGAGPQSWDSIRAAGAYTVWVRDRNNIGADGSIAASISYPSGVRAANINPTERGPEYSRQTHFQTYNIWKNKSRNYTRKFSRQRRLRALGY